MQTAGLDLISIELEKEAFFFKCILNQSAAIFFPGAIQHRDIKQLGVSYEDDYRGNALAATITPQRIDIRFHKDYSDDAVLAIFTRLLKAQEMSWARDYSIAYQGRTLSR